MDAKVIDQGWELYSLSINKSYATGTDGGARYAGKIRFVNGKSEELGFTIPPEKMADLLAIISDSVVASARELGQGLVKSILPAANRTLEDFGNNPPI